MNTNPYQTPAAAEPPPLQSSLGKQIARALVFLYAVFFTLFCGLGTIDDIVSGAPALETLFWFVMSVLTCYGIFALAVRQLRFPALARFWRAWAYLLPVLSYLGVAWDLSQETGFTIDELVMITVLFAIVTTPALVANWMVASRMHRRHPRSIDPAV